jgi:acyl-CoA reductase-like NAD-dependent aldehyde dehydrogenase
LVCLTISLCVRQFFLTCFLLLAISRNAPYHLGLRSITFPLAAGNTAIFKGPEAAPRCAWAIADVFREAGLPAGCLNLITHKASEGSAIAEQLVAHPRVKKINFTGSTRVGRVIAASAGKHLKPVLMELGGKNSAIVLADANIENAATQCALGAFMNVSFDFREFLSMLRAC